MVSEPVTFRLSIAVVVAFLLPPLSTAVDAAPQAAAQQGSTAAPDPAIVERRLTDAVRQSPDSVRARHALASFYLHYGRLDAAIPHLERARAIDPGHYESGYDLAVALQQSGRLDRARQQVRGMLAARETAELRNLLGDIEEQGGNFTAAAEAYQRAAHMDATEEHLFDWGNNLVQMRAFEPAAEVFTAAIARHPKSARLHVGLGIAHYSRGQYESAVRSFCEAADLEPKDPRPYQFLGEMYGVAPELATEISARLARFVKAQPRNALAHFQYAMSLWKTPEAAAQAATMRRVELLLRRATVLDPRMAKAYFELGTLLADQKRYAEAIPELRQAVRLQPDLSQAHYRLAQAYQRTGQKALAAKQFEIFEQLKATAR